MFAKSIPGPRYKEKGWPCQDSSGKKQLDHIQVIAVSDGHGSEDCFRSEIGSALAIEAAFELTELAFEDDDELDGIASFSESAIQSFTYQLWQSWKEKVKADWDNRLEKVNQLGEGEVRFESVSDKYKERYTSSDQSIVEKYLYIAYGTTLIVAIAIQSEILLLQIGDGTCVVLQQNGEFTTPVPVDEDNFLNVTVSMCEEEAYLKFRYAILDCDLNQAQAPAAVFLSTDGIDDCYPTYQNEQYLYQLYTVIIENILKIGIINTEEEIETSLLPKMSEQGSRDDISLASLIYEDRDVLQYAYDRIKLHKDEEKEDENS